MTTSQLRVFVSHAHENKKEAEELATVLRGKGVPAWLDKWEVQPGDSLIQKIFEVGLRDCKVFLVLLSTASVKSAWVREELDVAMIKRIEGSTRVIPVIVEPCDIPMALKPLLWVDLAEGVERTADRIADVFFDRQIAPPVVPQPSSLTFAVPGLTQDAARLAVHLSGSLDSPDGRPRAIGAPELASAMSMEPERVNDAVAELESRGLVELHHYLGSSPFDFSVVEPTYALALHLRGTPALHYDPEQDILAIAAAVVAKKNLDGTGLAGLTKLSPARINAAVAYLEEYGLAEVRHTLGTTPYAFRAITATGATRRFATEQAK